MTVDEVRQARRAAGRALAVRRDGAGVTQSQLARWVCYSRSTVANVERGRQNVPRSFWQRCDAAMSAGGSLLAAFDRADALARLRLAQLAAERERHRLAEWGVRADHVTDSLRVPVGVGWPP